ncbi:MAG: LysM peptidoglycan-binding domain-containing protein [Chloroflexota bacterium]
MNKRFILTLALVLAILPISPVDAQTTGGPVYIVQPGDTLSSIAARFNISLTDLMDANGISDPNLLSAGQELVIPGLEGVGGVLLTEVVQFGDSYRSLRRRTQVPEAMLRKLNRLVSPTELYVGVNLITPQQGSAAQLNSRAALSNGETLLELAVKHNTHPWALVQVNQLASAWSALPNDVLYFSSDTPGQGASGLPPAFQRVEVSPLPLTQGDTAVIRVQTPEGVTLGGLLVDHELRFFPDAAGGQAALQGVHALLEPGIYPLRLEASLPDGSKQSFEQMVLVVSGNYPSTSIIVSDVTTLDPAIMDAESQKILEVIAPVNPQRYWQGAFQLPVDAQYCITAWFGDRRSYNDGAYSSFHSGIDYGICSETKPFDIYAPAPGVVTLNEQLIVRGIATVIDHGQGIYTGYWHQEESYVTAGQAVTAGQLIGKIGKTGRVTGPHLHWEIWVNGVQVNPVDWLERPYP